MIVEILNIKREEENVIKSKLIKKFILNFLNIKYKTNIEIDPMIKLQPTEYKYFWIKIYFGFNFTETE